MRKKIIGLCMTVIVLVGFATISASAISRDEAVNWAKAQVGEEYDVDGINGLQCSDFATAYINYLISGNPYSGNYTTYDGKTYFELSYPDGWQRIANTADFVPEPGDILCFAGGSKNAAGHVAVAIEGCTVSYMKAVDQDGYRQGPAQYSTLSYYSDYYNFQGVIRPKFSSQDKTPPTIKNYRTTNVTAQSITVSMNLSDDVGVTSVWFNIWGPNGNKGYSVSASNGSFSHTIKTSDYGGEGKYSIHAYASDAAGNQTGAALNSIYTPVNLGDSFFGIISHHASGKPIEVGDDKYIVLGTKNGKANQVWKFQRESDGCYTIASNKTKNLLEMSAGKRENGTQVSAWVEDWGGYYQRWYIYPQGDGYVILSKHYTADNRVLDLDHGNSNDGTKILTYERLNNTNQIYDITKLTIPTVSVSSGTSAKSTVFKWNDFYGSESYYDLKLWNGTYWVGDTYRLEWNTKSPCAMHLPAGHYEGYVDFTIGKLGAMSNVVKFDVTEDNSMVNVFSRRTVTDTGYNIHADIKYLTQSAVYTAALYSSDGKLLDVQSLPISSGATSADVAFTKQTGAAYVKVFLWDSLESMQPLTESERINL